MSGRTNHGGQGPLGASAREVGVSFAAPEGRLEALHALSLDVPGGSLTVVIGPNGCGKSTLLRIMAGLLPPDHGSITLGDDLAPPHAGDGRVGLAFQQPRLVPWLTTADNVALPLSLAGSGALDRRARVLAVLAQVGLADAAGLRPRELSGGMAQRAALARALITDPPLLLLDEPFSALDALTREAFDSELQRLWLEHPRTIVLVTHSVAEAVRMADRIVVMTPRPGSVHRVVPVPLTRPRPVRLAGDPGAAAIENEVRAALAEVRPPELAPWVAA